MFEPVVFKASYFRRKANNMNSSHTLDQTLISRTREELRIKLYKHYVINSYQSKNRD
jgi:hypothetical protein